jgi:hypothetical protein
MSIDLEPIQPPVVFVPGEAIAIRVHQKARTPSAYFQSPISLGTHGELLYSSTDQSGLSYEVFSPPRGLVLPERLAPEAASRYLSLPSKLSPKIPELALELTPGATEPVEIARQLERELRRRYKYDLGSPSGAAKDPLEHFLFESKRGHCEFYSTAMAIMLRIRGVPSRNVTGFVGGTYNRFGEFYAVRQGDAHSWVEAYLPRLGWTRFDPTPPSSAAPQAATEGALALLREMVEAMAQGWNQNVEGFDLDKQVGLFQSVRNLARDLFFSENEGSAVGGKDDRSLRPALGYLLGGLLLASAWIAWRRRNSLSGSGPRGRHQSERKSIDLARRLDAALVSCGVPRPTGTPAKTHAEALVSAGHPAGKEALSLSEIYLDVRFGSGALNAETERAFRVRVQKLRRLEVGQSSGVSTG